MALFKTDLDFWDCFERKITLSYNQRNTVGPAQTVPKEQSKVGLQCLQILYPMKGQIDLPNFKLEESIISLNQLMCPNI